MAHPAFGDSIAFLLSATGAHAAGVFASEVEAEGISPRAFGVLSNLASLGPRSQQRLADELGMHRNNMVGLVDDLEARDWVRRERDPHDRRAYRLQVTDVGLDVLRRAEGRVPRLDDALTAGLGADERAELRRLLGRIAETAGLRPGVHPYLAAR